MRKTIILFTLSLLSAVVWGQSYTYRYWTDNDVAAAKTGSATGETQFSVDIASLGSGLHALHVQARNAGGEWSSTRTRHFLIDKSQMLTATTARYWIDDDMTTVHNGVATSGSIDIDVTKLTVGLHAIHYQTFAADGTPSSARTRYILVDKVHKDILKATVRIDGGAATTHALSDGDIVIDIGELKAGEHTVSVTLTDIAGNDYGTEQNTFMVYDGNEPIQFADNLTKAICLKYWDTNGDGELSRNEATAVQRIGTVFQGYDITSFDELQYFTGLSQLGEMEFAQCAKLTSVVF